MKQPIAIEIEERALSSTALSGDGVPDKVVLAPWGKVESQKGEFFVDEESVQEVLRAFREHGTDLPIDYEHQTLGGDFASPDGKAPAAGWIKSMSAEPAVGIVGHIAWTQQARQMLAARQYRYLSPVALIRKSDRKLIAIHSAALTNKPAIVAMEAIVNREAAADDSDFEAQTTLCLLREELQLSAATTCAEVLNAAHARLRELQTSAQHVKSEERVLAAMRCGKLTAAQKPWATALIAKDEALFEEWLSTAPVVVRPGQITAPDTAKSDQRRHGAAARARAEFQSNPTLSKLTTEDAYVADALRF